MNSRFISFSIGKALNKRSWKNIFVNCRIVSFSGCGNVNGVLIIFTWLWPVFSLFHFNEKTLFVFHSGVFYLKNDWHWGSNRFKTLRWRAKKFSKINLCVSESVNDKKTFQKLCRRVYRIIFFENNFWLKTACRILMYLELLL